MKDHQQNVGEMMKDRAVPVWHLQTAQNETSSCGGSDETTACNIHHKVKQYIFLVSAPIQQKSNFTVCVKMKPKLISSQCLRPHMTLSF